MDYVNRVGEWGGRVAFIGGFLPMPGASALNLERTPKKAPYYAIEQKIAEDFDHVYFVDVGPSMNAKAIKHADAYEGHQVYCDGVHFSHLGAMILAGKVLEAFGLVQNRF